MAELEWVLSHKFMAGASSGLCPVSSQMIKHLGKKGLDTLSNILNLPEFFVNTFKNILIDAVGLVR